MIRRFIAGGCLAACFLAGPVAASEEKAEPPPVPKDFVYGLHFLKARDYPRAIAHLTEAIQAHALKPQRLSDAHYFRGRALTRTKRDELALADFTLAVTYWPENVKALRVRCRALTLQDKLADAKADCDQAVLLAPDDWRGWFTRGLLHDKKNDRSLALSDFTAAQARMPDGMDTFPAVSRQLRAYDLLKNENQDTAPAGPTHPVWVED
ncbi:MAG: tetratricopeptide repeat protein [Rhodospirillales bacterium]